MRDITSKHASGSILVPVAPGAGVDRQASTELQSGVIKSVGEVTGQRGPES